MKKHIFTLTLLMLSALAFSQKIDSTLTETFKNNKWNKSSTTTIAYDNQERIIKMASYLYDTVVYSFYPYYMITYDYSDNYTRISTTSFYDYAKKTWSVTKQRETKLSGSFSGVKKGDTYDKTVEVWPNPVNDLLFIKSNDKMNMTITDITGNVIMDGVAYDQMSVSNLPKGIYMVTLWDPDNKVTFKIVKQ